MKYEIDDLKHGFEGRLAEVVRNSGLNREHFGKLVGTSGGYIAEILFKGKKPGYDLLVAIAEKFPQYSLDWLMRGIEPERKQPAPQQPTPTAHPAQDIHRLHAPTPASHDELLEARVEARIWHQAFSETMERVGTALLSCETRLSQSHHDASPRGDKHKPGTGTDGLSAGLG
jgi:transcriptional regulator with XRE-family HTH domain